MIVSILVRMVCVLAILLGIIYVLGNFQASLAYSLYPITYEYQEVNITERMTTGGYCGYLVADDGNWFYACNDLFWSSIPDHRYRIEFAYNYSTTQSTLTFGKTQPIITNITRIP
jgi:hypothetical protein